MINPSILCFPQVHKMINVKCTYITQHATVHKININIYFGYTCRYLWYIFGPCRPYYCKVWQTHWHATFCGFLCYTPEYFLPNIRQWYLITEESFNRHCPPRHIIYPCDTSKSHRQECMATTKMSQNAHHLRAETGNDVMTCKAWHRHVTCTHSYQHEETWVTLIMRILWTALKSRSQVKLVHKYDKVPIDLFCM